MDSPSAWCYGDYNGNYGAHQMAFTDARGIDYYFSYRTLVAFRSPRTGLVVRQNVWGPTTGKHINAIDNGRKSERVDSYEFEHQLMLAQQAVI